MTSHDLILIAVVYIFASALSALLQRVWPAPDPHAQHIARLERRIDDISKQLGLQESPLNEVQELIEKGLKIMAIKLYREQNKVSVMAAKEAADNMEAQMKNRGLA